MIANISGYTVCMLCMYVLYVRMYCVYVCIHILIVMLLFVQD